MTVVQNAGRLEIIFAVSLDRTRRESITSIRPTATDQDPHLAPDVNLISMCLKKLNQLLLF